LHLTPEDEPCAGNDTLLRTLAYPFSPGRRLHDKSQEKGNEMPNDPVMTAKGKTLIALGASVAAGCQPCTEFQVRAAREAGACDRGIQLAVETALAVRYSATRSMDRWSERCQGARPELDATFRGETQVLAELVSISAAVCVQSVSDLILHLSEARQSGATAEQIRAAVGIAKSIRNAAMEQIDAALAGEDEHLASAAGAGGGCAPGQPCGCS
jgi:AhpD family alkylhydroperoxidase